MNCCGGHGNHDRRTGTTGPEDGTKAGLVDQGQHDSTGTHPQVTGGGQDPTQPQGHGHGRGPGMLLMMLCCLLPVLLVAGFLVRGRGAGGGGFAWLMLLLCPLMHVFMMGQPGNKKHQ